MPKKLVKLEEEDILLEENNENEIVENDDEEIEAIKVPDKVKRKYTITPEEREIRIQRLRKSHENRRAKKVEADKQKVLEAEQLKKQTEEKIVKRAVAIKKKQIIKEAILEEMTFP